jgi:hypothetical protein
MRPPGIAMNFRRTMTALLAVLLVLPAAALAGAQVQRSASEFHVSALIISPCNGEPIRYEGDVRVRTQTIVSENGSVHSLFDSTANFDAVGLVSGDRYTFVLNSHTVESSTVSGAQTQTATGHQLLISSGPSDNLVLTVLLHYSITPDGQTAVQLELRNERCVG